MNTRRGFIAKLLGSLGLLSMFDILTKGSKNPAIEVSNGFRRLTYTEREKLLQRGIRTYYVTGKNGQPQLMTHVVKNVPQPVDKDFMPSFTFDHGTPSVDTYEENGTMFVKQGLANPRTAVISPCTPSSAHPTL